MSTSLVVCALLLGLGQPQAAPQTSGQAPPGPIALITGRVIDGTAQKPVSAAVVTIKSANNAAAIPVDRVLTDNDGRYFFEGLGQGFYNLTVTRPGWVDGAYGRERPDGATRVLRITTDDQRVANVDLKLWKHSVLSGVVLDEAGEPVVDVLVRAVRRQLVGGRARLVFSAAARTNDLGEFRLAGLMPGDYTVLAPNEIGSGPVAFRAGSSPTEWLQTMTGIGTAPTVFERETGVLSADGRSLITSASPLSDAPDWMAPPPTFLGGGTSPTAFVHVGSGEERGGLSLPIRRVPTRRISGRLAVPGATPANHVLHLLPAEFADVPLFDVATAVADGAGQFTFYGVPEGSYVIRVVRSPEPLEGRFAVMSSVRDASFVAAVGSGPRGGAPPPVDDRPIMYADAAVSVGAQSVDGLVITLREGVTLAGRAEFEGTSPRPPDLDWLRATIQVSPVAGYTPFNAPYGRFAADGTFKTSSVLRGGYVLRPPAFGRWHVKSVNVGGLDVTDRVIDVRASLTDIVVTYTDQSMALSGTVAGSDDERERASVLLFPAAREFWTNYGETSARLALVRAQTNGAFSFAVPMRGEYIVVAIPEDQTADWQDPAALARLAALGTSVSIRDGAQVTVNLQIRSLR